MKNHFLRSKRKIIKILSSFFKLFHTFLQLFASNLDSSCRYSIPITNSGASDDLLKQFLSKISGNRICCIQSIAMTVVDFVELKHNWVMIFTSFTHWSIDELLFSPVKLWSWRFHCCCSSKVRFWSLQFMQLVGASCRSRYDMNTELWT